MNNFGCPILSFARRYAHPVKAPLLALLSFALAFTSSATDKLSNSAVGTTDATGKLIIHVFESESHDSLPVHLSTDYGVMMFRGDDGWCRFTLASKATKSVREFTNYDAYLGALTELPKGSTLCIYDRCLVPTFYDFYPVHTALYQKFLRDCRKRGLNVAKEPKITCTCAAVEPN